MRSLLRLLSTDYTSLEQDQNLYGYIQRMEKTVMLLIAMMMFLLIRRLIFGVRTLVREKGRFYV